MNIITKLLPSGQHEIFLDEGSIGKVWKFKNSHIFGLSLNGVYWDTTGKMTTQGSPIKRFNRMKDAIKYIEDVLEEKRRRIKMSVEAKKVIAFVCEKCGKTNFVIDTLEGPWCGFVYPKTDNIMCEFCKHDNNVIKKFL